MVIPKDNVQESEIMHLITTKTKTLSGKSTLTYHLGRDEKSNAYIRIYSNTNNGYFSAEWIKLSDILNILEKQPASFTTYILQPLFAGKSVNTPPFLSSALLKEKVIAVEKGKSRKFVYLSPGVLLDKIASAEPSSTAKKAAAKKGKKQTK